MVDVMCPNNARYPMAFCERRRADEGDARRMMKARLPQFPRPLKMADSEFDDSETKNHD
jgi:hypothetical protein